MKNTINKTFFQADLAMFYLAPALLLAATVAKTIDPNDNFKASVAGGVLTCFAFFCFVFVMLRLTTYSYEKLPKFSTVMRVVTVYACFVGFTFGLDGVLTAVTNDAYSFWTMPGAAIFPYTGLIWPISLIILGAVFYSKKVMPPLQAGLLVLCGILFPMGRIPGNEILHYAADIAFLATFSLIANQLKSPVVEKQRVELVGG